MAMSARSIGRPSTAWARPRALRPAPSLEGGEALDLGALLGFLGALLPLVGALRLARLTRYRQPLLQLFLDLVGVLRLRLQSERLVPLEAGLAFAPHAPIGIAQVIVENGILGSQLHRALQMLHGFLVVAHAV